MAEIRLARAALAYASLGWPVFPVRPLEKTPQIKAWREKATADPKQIRSWWRKFPEANIGIVTGQRSGLVWSILIRKTVETFTISVLSSGISRHRLPAHLPVVSMCISNCQ